MRKIATAMSNENKIMYIYPTKNGPLRFIGTDGKLLKYLGQGGVHGVSMIDRQDIPECVLITIEEMEEIDFVKDVGEVIFRNGLKEGTLDGYKWELTIEPILPNKENKNVEQQTTITGPVKEVRRISKPKVRKRYGTKKVKRGKQPVANGRRANKTSDKKVSKR